MTNPVAAVRLSNDDLNVILQDWSYLDPDQLVSIQMATELLRMRSLLGRAQEAHARFYMDKGWTNADDDLQAEIDRELETNYAD